MRSATLPVPNLLLRAAARQMTSILLVCAGLMFFPQSFLQAQSRDVKIVAFGNSITAQRKTVQKVFAQRLPELLKERGINATVINSGVGGSHSGRVIDNRPTAHIQHAQNRFQAQVLDHHPDLVIIGFGANDAYIDTKKPGDPSRIPLEKFRNNMSFMVETLQAAGIKVILMATNGYKPENRDFLHERLLEYISEVEKIARKYNTGFVNNQATFEKFEQSTGKSASILFEDYLHPNDEGHRLIAESLAGEIQKVLASRKAAKKNILVSKDQNGAPVTLPKASRWESYRKQVRARMETVMGLLPDRKLPAPVYEVTDSLKTAKYTRLHIRVKVKDDEVVPAYLYLPNSIKKGDKIPAMIALHETDPAGKKSVDGEGSYEKSRQTLGYGKELAARGYVVIAPDYPSFGESIPYDFTQDAYESGTMKGIFNHMRCIDLLEQLDFVDNKNIGAIGHSLGGHNSMFLSAFDERVKVTVSSCGWTQLDYYDIGPEASERYGGRLGPFAQQRYMPLWSKYGLDGAGKPFEYHELILTIAPRAFFSSSPTGDKNFDVAGVKEGIWLAEKGYSYLSVPNRLQVRYPETGHEFPSAAREEAYQFIDQILSKKK